MAFILKKTDLTELHKETTKEFAYNDDLKISFKSLANPKFQRAYGIIGQKSGIDTPLNAKTIANINDDELTVDEALLFAVGEHLVADWNVENENGEKLLSMVKILHSYRQVLMTLWHFFIGVWNVVDKLPKRLPNKPNTPKKSRPKVAMGSPIQPFKRL